jgi:hypothetical protein
MRRRSRSIPSIRRYWRNAELWRSIACRHEREVKMNVIPLLACAVTLASLSAASIVYADGAPPIVRDSVQVTVYDGITDDLLSAGLNQAGLISATPPGFADALNPTPAELRRRAIYGNYRAIVDPVAGGGIGLLWGPQSPGRPSLTERRRASSPAWNTRRTCACAMGTDT